jgi:hypothetical protein
MILAEAIEFTKRFPSYHPKIFTGFVESNNGSPITQSYVVLATSTNESFSPQMDDYIKAHQLKVERFKDYWLVCTQI